MSVTCIQVLSVGQICRFCRKPRGRRSYSPVPPSVCDTAARQTSPKTPLAPCTRRHRASGNCRGTQVTTSVHIFQTSVLDSDISRSSDWRLMADYPWTSRTNFSSWRVDALASKCLTLGSPYAPMSTYNSASWPLGCTIPLPGGNRKGHSHRGYTWKQQSGVRKSARCKVASVSRQGPRPSPTCMSWWKHVMAACRFFMGTSMSWTTWCCSYSFLMVSPWVSFSSEILGGTIQPKSQRNTGLLPKGMMSWGNMTNTHTKDFFVLFFLLIQMMWMVPTKNNNTINCNG